MSQGPDARAADRSSLDRWRGWIVLAALLAGLLAVILIYQRPAHLFHEGAHLRVWRADLAKVLASQAVGCPFGYTVGVTHVPGVGNIDHVCVYRYSQPHTVLVEFFPVSGEYQLAHVQSGAPPPGEFSHPLGHGWWQIVRMNQTTLSCPRGFNVDPSP